MRRGLYLGEWGGKSRYSYESDKEYDGPGYITPITICASKCGEWWHVIFEYAREGQCWKCWDSMFEGEPDIPLIKEKE